jgi:hypothetical protein
MNYFEQLAETQQTAASKAKDRAREKRAARAVVKSEADAPMVATAAEKAQAEKNTLLRQWKAWRRERSDEVLEGPHGRDYRQLLLLVGSLTASSAPALVQYVQGCAWLRQADRETRRTALTVIDDAIVLLRIKQGLAPFDDSLPGEPPTAFEQVREALGVLT